MKHSLLGGVAMTRLRVYDQRPGPDGVDAGCAHIHGLSDEAYYCLAGRGAVELHDLQHGFRRHLMEPGSYLQFPPGTLHRSVSYDRCEFLVIMGNGGLPEHGDARIYFGTDIDGDPAAYSKLRELAAEGLEGALRRRDASVSAYLELLRQWEQDRSAYFDELERFYSLHRQQLASRRSDYLALLQAGAGKALETSLERIHQLPGGAPSQPIRHANTRGLKVVFGMCGVLQQIDPSGALLPQVDSADN